jgi:hypothetical protein
MCTQTHRQTDVLVTHRYIVIVFELLSSLIYNYSTGKSNVLIIRGGEAVHLGKRKRAKPSFIYMIKAFFR